MDKMPLPTDEQYQLVVDQLIGTCNSLEEALDNVFPDNADAMRDEPDLHTFIDNQIFQCEECGWWCDVGERATENEDGTDVVEEICKDCHDG